MVPPQRASQWREQQQMGSASPLGRVTPPPTKRDMQVKVKYSNKTRVLLCYILVFGMALALPIAMLVWVYPYTLVGTAPDVAENLLQTLPGLRRWLGATADAASIHGLSGTALGLALVARDLHWRVFVGSVFLLCWLLSLILQLLWRRSYRRPLMASRSTRRAVRSFRLMMLLVFVLNLLGGALVYFLGIRFISEKTFWDWALFAAGFLLNIVAAWICFRLAAPPAISGKHGFFIRL